MKQKFKPATRIADTPLSTGVLFSDLPDLVKNCSYATTDGQRIQNSELIMLLEWAENSIPMLKLAGEILGKNNIVDTDFYDENYCWLLENAGWDSVAVDWIMKFFSYAQFLPEIQIQK
ncbi:hypothetical protein [Endozoicomonas sp. ALB091]|uniref:hypothetical protein n=1 Tax=Endozoicomonas sp. ALB091 TaxID=3403073 RepID=UPI003BB6E3BE